MAVYYELIADDPGAIVALVGSMSTDSAKVELTDGGDLYVSIDLRGKQDEKRPPRSELEAELASLDELELAPDPPGPTVGWDQARPAGDLVYLGRADALLPVVEGARVVCVGDHWPTEGSPSRYTLVDPVIGHVLAVTNEGLVVGLADGDEVAMHPDRVAVVERTTADGDAVLILGNEEREPEAADPGREDPEPDPEPQVEGEVEGEGATLPELPPRFGPGTCGGTILAVLTEEGGHWPIAKVLEHRRLKSFAKGSVRTTMAVLCREGHLRRVEPGVYAAP